MLNPSVVERVLDCGQDEGADFVEIFAEESYSNELSFVDSRPNAAIVGRLSGIGLRLFFGNEQIYTTTNDFSEAALLASVRAAAEAGRQGQPPSRPGQVRRVGPISPMRYDSVHHAGAKPWEWDLDKKISYLRRLDRAARARSSWVTQVEPGLTEKYQKVLVANSSGVWVENQRSYINARVAVFVEDQGERQEAFRRHGEMDGAEAYERIPFEELAQEAVDRATKLVHAANAPAGEFPVVIDKGFGGVIFHEACGHGLETTSVAKGASVFCGLLGQRVAAECVTAIDDGTLPNKWGSLDFDDEGRPTQRTVLIEKGVLKSYIVDHMGERLTGYARTGSGRRQSYKFAPASRMRNTFIDQGQDRLEDLIGDVDLGLYAREMGGGSVNPSTGDFNFGVLEAHMIRGGRLAEPVKGAMLIGRGVETLGRITKVANNLELSPGTCGSISGQIPTTVGQPAILVSKMTVGGRA